MQRVGVHTRMHCWTCSKIPLHPGGLKYLLVFVIWVSDALGDVIFTRFLFSLQLLTAAYPFLPNHCFTVFLWFSFLPPTPLLSSATVLYLYISFSLLSFFSMPHCRCCLFHTSPFTLSASRCRHILQNVFLFSHLLLVKRLFFSIACLNSLTLLFGFMREAKSVVDVRWWMVVSPLAVALSLVSRRKRSGSPPLLLLPPLALDCDLALRTA